LKFGSVTRGGWSGEASTVYSVLQLRIFLKVVKIEGDRREAGKIFEFEFMLSLGY